MLARLVALKAAPEARGVDEGPLAAGKQAQLSVRRQQPDIRPAGHRCVYAVGQVQLRVQALASVQRPIEVNRGIDSASVSLSSLR